MTSRISHALVLCVVVLATATACVPSTSPSAEPSPSPTFTSSDQAYAAAEKTYRAYVDALNHVDLSDPKTFEPVYAWTTGDALAGEKKPFSQMHADGWVVSGKSRYDNFRPLSFDPQRVLVSATVCLDVTDVEVVDGQGESMVPAGRNDRQPITLTFIRGNSGTGLVIASSQTATELSLCAG